MKPIALMLAVSLLAGSCHAANPVYDVTQHTGKPSSPLPGLSAMRMVYGQELWTLPRGITPAQKAAILLDPDLEKIAAVARTWPTDRPICIDIEQWSQKLEDLPVTVDKFCKVADAIRAANPDCKFGFYMAMPVRNYFAGQPYYLPGGAGYAGQVKKMGEGNTWYDTWSKQNAAYMPVAQKVDYIFPSLYTFYEDRETWKNYAAANIKQAKQYGKPIIPVIWFLYHDAASPANIRNKPIPPDYWTLELETINGLADGVAIWGGWKMKWPGESEDEQPWWTATKAFIAK